MRTIKFRAWNKDGKHMIDLHKVTPLALDANLKQDGVFVPFNPSLEIMQFTGLTDKNGVEIYEGDVLQCWTKDFDNQPFKSFTYVVKDIRQASMSGDSWWETQGEVIGNIHENADLIKT